MRSALIVEDEPAANKLLSMLVELRGYRTDSAFTGGEALEMLDRGSPDIVFLDLMLPDVNGYEVCKAVKSRKDTATIPVVMVTARVAAENRLQCYRVGADYYVPKPYTPDQIYEAMDDADGWRRRIGGPETAGEVALDSDDDGESLRRLTQLRSQLFAQTPMGLEAAGRLHACLRRWLESADDWGRAHGAPAVAVLAFRALPDRVELTLRDRAGWLRDDPRPPAERWAEDRARGCFDEVQAAPDGGAVTFVVRFRGDGPAA